MGRRPCRKTCLWSRSFIRPMPILYSAWRAAPGDRWSRWPVKSKIYSTKSGELQHKKKKHTDWINALAFSPSGAFLASGDRNGGITIWDPENGQELFTLAGHKASVTALSWRGDSKLLASCSEDGAIKLWEMQEGKQAKTWEAHKGGALSVSYTHDGRLVSCGRDNQILV